MCSGEMQNALACVPPEARKRVGVAEQRRETFRERRLVVRLYKIARLSVSHLFLQAANASGHHRQVAGERLHRRERLCLGSASDEADLAGVHRLHERFSPQDSQEARD